MPAPRLRRTATSPRARPTIDAVGEFDFLAQLLPLLPRGAGVEVPPGDDCAVVVATSRRLLLTADALVDGVHFRRAWMTPRQIGRKAYLVNASDIAAMGGRPRFCLVSVGAPPDFPAIALRDIHRGLAAAAGETGAAIVGGNLTRSRQLMVSVALVGEAPRHPALRRGARAGDLVYVTGSLGAAALGLRALQRDSAAQGADVRRFREPPARLRAGALLAGSGVSAMIDVSDGLLQDLGHLCEASGVGAQVEAAAIPCSVRVRRAGLALALSGGEDYELLCAVPPRHVERVERLRAQMECPLTRIGRFVAKREGLRVLDETGHARPVNPLGFDHFAAGRRR